MTDGVAIVDKPAGMTSHDVVSAARRELNERRIGHAGTLDPDATGVLVLGVGRGTRLLQFVAGADKRYEAEIVFGVETDTLDAAGTVVATHDMSGLDHRAVRAGAATFVGALMQVPPMVSAIKIGGKRLYDLAREGIEVERAPRPVRIDRFDVEPIAPLVYRAVIDCSSGTYIRSLAADLGRSLGGGAHLRALRRTRVGAFDIEESQALGHLSVRPLLDALRGMPVTVVGGEVEQMVRHGRVLDATTLSVTPIDGGQWAVVSSAGELLAVYRSHHSERVKPAVVLVPSG